MGRDRRFRSSHNAEHGQLLIERLFDSVSREGWHLGGPTFQHRRHDGRSSVFLDFLDLHLEMVGREALWGWIFIMANSAVYGYVAVQAWNYPEYVDIPEIGRGFPVQGFRFKRTLSGFTPFPLENS
jgi:hypothetical protein